MSIAWKVLGQAAPPLDTLTDLYPVPANAQAVALMLVVSYIGDANDPTASYRASVAVAGEADAPKQIQLNDIQVAANVPEIRRIAWTLGAGDVVRVRCRDAECAFTLYGLVKT